MSVAAQTGVLGTSVRGSDFVEAFDCYSPEYAVTIFLEPCGDVYQKKYRNHRQDVICVVPDVEQKKIT